MLRYYGVSDVTVEMGLHPFSDAFDYRRKVIYLEPSVFNGNSVTAHAVACHECGHAVQHAKKYVHVATRNAILPLAIGANHIM